MESECLWDLFAQTGSPMAYVLYRLAQERQDASIIA
jgi:hypothetical protein